MPKIWLAEHSGKFHAMTTKQAAARVDLAYKKITDFSPEQIELIKGCREVDLTGNSIRYIEQIV